MIHMDIAGKIRAVCGATRISEAELSRRIGTSPQAFSSRMRTAKFTTEELEAMADALGVKYVAYFEFPDGSKI